jgi:hypothetical protein
MWITGTGPAMTVVNRAAFLRDQTLGKEGRMSIKRGGFWYRLGDYLSDPWGEFLVDVQQRTLLRRICFGVILALAFWFDANGRTILFFVGLWGVYEAIFYATRCVKAWWNAGGETN